MFAQRLTTPPSLDCGLLADLPPSTSGALREVFAMHGVKMPFDRDEEVFGEGEQAEFVYMVLKGAVRLYRILSDGRRPISDFLLPGDVFGLEAQVDHRLSAEAIGPTTVAMVRRATLAKMAADDRSVASAVWASTIQSFQRTQDHMLLLSRQGACERLCSFLLDLAGRSAAADEVNLPMSRQDIGDYLGLTIETVSRTLTQLQGSGWIRLPATRRVVLANLAAIRRVCS